MYESIAKENGSAEVLRRQAKIFAEERKLQDALRQLQQAMVLAPADKDSIIREMKELRLLTGDGRELHDWETLAEGLCGGDATASEKLKSSLVDKETATTFVRSGALVLLLDTLLLPLSDHATEVGHVLLLLTRNSEAACAAIAEWLRHEETRPTAMVQASRETQKALVNVVLLPSVWHSTNARSSVVCHLVEEICTAISLTCDRLDLLVQLFSMKEPAGLKLSVKSRILPTVLKSLDCRLDERIRSRAIVVLAHLLRLKITATAPIQKYVVDGARSGKEDELICALSSFAVLFTVDPQSAESLFLQDGFLQEILADAEVEGVGIQTALLGLASASCTSKKCREVLLSGDYMRFFLKCTTDHDERLRCLAALIVVKLESEGGQKNFVNSEEQTRLAKILRGMLLEGRESSTKSMAIEGIAHATFNSSVKEAVSLDKPILTCLLDVVQQADVDAILVFGALTILDNLTRYRPVLSKEQQQVQNLKRMAAAGETGDQKERVGDKLDNETYVDARCRRVLDAGVVKAFGQLSKTSVKSERVNALMAAILLSLATQRMHRGTIVQQGGLVALVSIFPQTSSAKENTLAITVAHALAKLLISVDPRLAFGSALSPTNAVRPLLVLLTMRDLPYELSRFETLLALTNLASVDDTIRNLIARNGWSTIEDLLVVEHGMLRRAAVELVCNLVVSVQAAVKFADGTTAAAHRVGVLIALCTDDDAATRSAAAGALAVLSGYEPVCTAIVYNKSGVKILLELLEEDDEGMRHRAAVIARNLICVPDGNGPAEAFVEAGGVSALKDVVQETKVKAVVEFAIEGLKGLVVRKLIEVPK
ncbi:Protein unc-45 A [Saitoella coloradoensis]